MPSSLNNYCKTSHYLPQAGTHSFEIISPLLAPFAQQNNKAILFYFTQISVSKFWFGTGVQRNWAFSIKLMGWMNKRTNVSCLVVLNKSEFHKWVPCWLMHLSLGESYSPLSSSLLISSSLRKMISAFNFQSLGVNWKIRQANCSENTSEPQNIHLSSFSAIPLGPGVQVSAFLIGIQVTMSKQASSC